MSPSSWERLTKFVWLSLPLLLKDMLDIYHHEQEWKLHPFISRLSAEHGVTSPALSRCYKGHCASALTKEC